MSRTKRYISGSKKKVKKKPEEKKEKTPMEELANYLKADELKI